MTKEFVFYFKELFRPKKILAVIRHYRLNKKYKGKGCFFALNTSIIDCYLDSNVYILGGHIKSSRIGRRTYFNSNIYAQNCAIGNYCSIGSDVTIGISPHPTYFVSTHPTFYANNKGFETFADRMYFDEEVKTTNIGNDVWIGSKCTIMPGVKIGDGAIIGYGALVTKDVPAYSIVGGVPARLIKFRFKKEIIDELNKIKWWEKSDEIIQSNYKLFIDPISFIEYFKRFS
jgi:acetyltransferase-like isoleucine patch superfamily enzyme